MVPIGRRRLRRPFVWLLFVQQLVAGAGIALPCPPAAAGSGERYPCEHCACGCNSAERCWTHCGCFTFEQKVAWARRSGIAVPEYAVAAAKRDAAAPPRTPCGRPQRRCESVAQAGEASHGDHARHPGGHRRGKDRLPRGVSWFNALRCHNLTQQWQAVTTSWPGDRHVQLCLALLPRGCIALPPLAEYLFSPLPPPTPPPNAA
jgi:hypothetical protein